MRFPKVALLCAIVVSQLGTLWAGRYTIDPNQNYAFLQPWFNLEQEERDTLAQGGVIVRSLPASDQQISVIAVCRNALSPEAFLTRFRSPEYGNYFELKGGRINQSPSLGDLAGLSLDQGDIDRLRNCVPGDCALNLSDSEMSDLQKSSDVQQAFRQVVLNRLRQYESGGLEALPESRNQKTRCAPR